MLEQKRKVPRHQAGETTSKMKRSRLQKLTCTTCRLVNLNRIYATAVAVLREELNFQPTRQMRIEICQKKLAAAEMLQVAQQKRNRNIQN